MMAQKAGLDGMTMGAHISLERVAQALPGSAEGFMAILGMLPNKDLVEDDLRLPAHCAAHLLLVLGTKEAECRHDAQETLLGNWLRSLQWQRCTTPDYPRGQPLDAALLCLAYFHLEERRCALSCAYEDWPLLFKEYVGSLPGEAQGAWRERLLLGSEGAWRVLARTAEGWRNTHVPKATRWGQDLLQVVLLEAMAEKEKLPGQDVRSAMFPFVVIHGSKPSMMDTVLWQLLDAGVDDGVVAALLREPFHGSFNSFSQAAMNTLTWLHSQAKEGGQGWKAGGLLQVQDALVALDNHPMADAIVRREAGRALAAVSLAVMDADVQPGADKARPRL